MAEFDPDSSDVNPRGGDRKKTEQPRTENQPRNSQRQTGPGAKARALSLLDSKITRFLGLWALVTVLLVQIIKLFSRSFTFAENYSGILAITFIIAAGLRYMTAQRPNLVGVVAFGVVFEKLSKPIRSLLGTAWSFLLLGFILVFVGQCSQNPNIPVENIFIISLDTYWSWLGGTWRKLLWYFGWN